ncbi:MAG: ribonuclease III [Crocinitomicaceae bacterium]
MFSAKRTEDELVIIRFILKQFGYKPVNVSYFERALTHKSVLPEEKHDFANERLEFLGDAILDAVVAEYLYAKYPDDDEGYLTKVKSRIVNRKSLALIGERMNIRSLLKYNQARSINLATLEGNAFEAIIGAIYLDGGFEKTKTALVKHVFRNHLNFSQLLAEELDFKSKLFIWCQKKKLNLEFELVQESHVNGQWNYEMAVFVNRTEYGRGKGFSKKEAEQAAARETLQLMGEI